MSALRERLRTVPRPVEIFVAGLAILLVLGVYHFAGWLTGERTIVAGTPAGTAQSTVAEVRIKKGQEACLTQVGMTPRTQVAVFTVLTHDGKPAQPLTLTASGDGYRATAAVDGYVDGKPVAQALDPPSGDLVGQVCWRNDGRRAVWLAGVIDPRAASVRSQTLIDGQPGQPDVSLRFDERKPSSMLGHLTQGFERLALWKPGIVGPWLLWILAVLLVVALPVGAVWAYAAAVRRDDDASLDTRNIAGGPAPAEIPERGVTE